jgi:hypothetical protein
MADGVLYVARGEQYLEAAVQSAQSVRRVMPAVPIAIATDAPAPADFDESVAMTEPDGYRAKILGMIASPFERTLLLDVDTYAVRDLSETFAILDGFDIAAAHDHRRAPLALDDVPDSFPELNTGVIALRRGENVQRFLNAWLDEYDRLQPRKPNSKDQPSFRRALYRATDVRVGVLPSEFNVRFWKAGYYNQPVRILHGWGDTATYEKVAAVLNDSVKSRGYRGVFIGYALLGEDAEVVGRFAVEAERWRRSELRAKIRGRSGRGSRPRNASRP